MKHLSWTRPIGLFAIILTLVVSTFAFTTALYKRTDDRIVFSLINHSGERVTQKDFAGRHQLVFFGFTHCAGICPVQMAKLSQVVNELEMKGLADRISPTFISVDPERDSPERISNYMSSFHNRFVGLTGSRVALEKTANSFRTFLQTKPAEPEDNYQIGHSSVVYVVDPFNRIVDFIPFEAGVAQITARVEAQI